LNGRQFQFVARSSENVVAGKEDRSTQTSVCDGRRRWQFTRKLRNIYSGRAGACPADAADTWGMFHWPSVSDVVYFSGTEALKLHPKVGRSQERGSINEFYKVEAEIVGEETDRRSELHDRLVKRWYYSMTRRWHHYLWLAETAISRGQTRTAFARNGQETPRENPASDNGELAETCGFLSGGVVDISPKDQKNPFLADKD